MLTDCSHSLTPSIRERVDDESFAHIVAYLSNWCLKHSQEVDKTFSWLKSALIQDLLSDLNVNKLDTLIDPCFNNFSGLLHCVKYSSSLANQTNIQSLHYK